MAANESNEPAGGSERDSGDPDIQLKKRARRRLIGAIALALLAIIVLPLVMDREPAPLAPEIAVHIPRIAGVPAGNTVPPTASPVRKAITQGGTDAATPSTASTNEPVSASGLIATPAQSAAAAPVGATAAGKADEKPTAPVKADVAPVAAASATASVNAPPAATASKAASVAHGSKDSAAVSADSAKWVVQLGAYQNSGNVAVLLGKLKEIRVPAFTEKIDSPQGERVRVRAGPFASKEAALAAQKRIRIIGVEGPVAPMPAK